jgi:TPP-dependent pyruvate/acetoin dehydrogenase alpha subunit
MRERLLAGQHFERMQARVQKQIAEALSFAKDSPFPDASELNTDVYA